MSDAPKTRRQMLEEFLAANPNDAFPLYGLAIECANTGDVNAAEEYFRRLVSAHPEYVASYYHYGQLLLRMGRGGDAQEAFRQGITAARKAGNAHALSELEAALEESATSGG
jgi:predicted Zn-dependent protease